MLAQRLMVLAFSIAVSALARVILAAFAHG